MKTQISLNIETEKNSIYKSDSQNIPKVNLTDLLYRKKTEDKKKREESKNISILFLLGIRSSVQYSSRHIIEIISKNFSLRE